MSDIANLAILQSRPPQTPIVPDDRVPPSDPGPSDSGDDPGGNGKRFPWAMLFLLLVIVAMSVRNMFVEQTRDAYKKGFQELRKTCADQNQLLKEQNEAIKAHDVNSEKFKAETALMACSAYNLGFAHYLRA